MHLLISLSVTKRTKRSARVDSLDCRMTPKWKTIVKPIEIKWVEVHSVNKAYVPTNTGVTMYHSRLDDFTSML